jgi:hypothetical protein
MDEIEKELDRLKRENRLLRYEVREALTLIAKTAGPASMYGYDDRENWKLRYCQLLGLYGQIGDGQ